MLDAKKVSELIKTLLEGAKKGLKDFEKVGKVTPFTVEISDDGNGVQFSASLNMGSDEQIVEDIEIPEGVDAAEFLKAKEKELISDALREAKGSYRKAAESLGISVRSLKRKLAELNL